MATANLKTIREYLSKKGWDIKLYKPVSYAFEITSPKGVTTLIRVKKQSAEIYKEITKADSLPDFVKKYEFDPGQSKPRAASGPRGSRQTKPIVSNVDTNYIGLGLKKRRVNAEAVEDTVIDGNSLTMKEDIEEMVDDEPLTVNYDVEVPKHLDGYYFPKFTNNILARVKFGRNIFVTGPTGTGKSEFVIHLAKLLGQRVIRVNLSVGTTEGHLVGKFVAKNGTTEFIYGILPIAMKNGWWLLLDEVDYAQPEHLSVLQPVLEGDNLLIVQNENEEIIPHENFRVFATANTKGRGDESQSYTGTNVLNMAWLDRWSVFEMEYTEFEKDIVHTILGKDPKLADQVFHYFEMLRKALNDGQLINTAFSTRRMQQVCEMLAIGEELRDVIKFELVYRYDTHEGQIVQEFAKDIWDQSHYLRGWKIGDDHKEEVA